MAPRPQMHPLRTLVALARATADLFWAAAYLSVPLLLLLLFTIVGTAGYHLLLGLSFLDALYQAVITLATVGFEEIVPFDPATKVFTIVLIIGGVGTVFYTLTLIVATVIEGELRRRFRRRIMQRKIDALRGHHVLCGFGRVGEEVARGLRERRTDFVVVDQDAEAVEKARACGHLVVSGSVTDEPTLRRAGVARARSVIATANSDAVNIYVALTAKHLNPECYVVVRSELPGSEKKLRLAGADQVISPHAISGRRMMLSAVQPLMTDFMDTLSAGRLGEQVLAEFIVSADSPLNGARLADAFADAPSARVLGIRRTDGELVVGPQGSQLLEEGDMVILLADEAHIARLDARR